MKNFSYQHHFSDLKNEEEKRLNNKYDQKGSLIPFHLEMSSIKSDFSKEKP